MLILVKGLEAYRRGWDAPCTTLGPEDELAVSDLVATVPDRYDELALCVNAFGGSSMAAFNIATLIRSRFRRITGYVPHVAASAASLLTVSADALLLPKCAYLTMVDPVLRAGHTPIHAVQVIRAGQRGDAGWGLEQRAYAETVFRMIDEQLDTLLRRAAYDDAARQSIRQRLLLAEGFHDAPIGRDELRAAGLRVEENDTCDTSEAVRCAEVLLRTLVRSRAANLVTLALP